MEVGVIDEEKPLDLRTSATVDDENGSRNEGEALDLRNDTAADDKNDNEVSDKEATDDPDYSEGTDENEVAADETIDKKETRNGEVIKNVIEAQVDRDDFEASYDHTYSRLNHCYDKDLPI